jgi:GNAT superfamily N-acetyltransferase
MDLPPPAGVPREQVPGPDASVRRARPADTDAIGAVQADTWRASYAGILPQATLDALEPEQLAAAWRSALTDPPTPRHALLVALAGSQVVGFAAVGPADPEEEGVGEIAAFVLAAEARGQGHGSRLLNAAADVLRENGFDHVVVWVLDGDEDRAAFLTGAGFVADGARRSLEVPGAPEGQLREQRLVAALSRPA